MDPKWLPCSRWELQIGGFGGSCVCVSFLWGSKGQARDIVRVENPLAPVHWHVLLNKRHCHPSRYASLYRISISTNIMDDVSLSLPVPPLCHPVSSTSPSSFLLLPPSAPIPARSCTVEQAGGPSVTILPPGGQWRPSQLWPSGFSANDVLLRWHCAPPGVGHRLKPSERGTRPL